MGVEERNKFSSLKLFFGLFFSKPLAMSPQFFFGRKKYSLVWQNPIHYHFSVGKANFLFLFLRSLVSNTLTLWHCADQPLT